MTDYRTPYDAYYEEALGVLQGGGRRTKYFSTLMLSVMRTTAMAHLGRWLVSSLHKVKWEEAQRFCSALHQSIGTR